MVLTGAGISTESGIPDFRGPNGVWTKNPAAEKTATLQYYVADPEVRKLAWQNRLRSEIWQAQPNAGHRALAELEQKATCTRSSRRTSTACTTPPASRPSTVVEIHGNVHEAKCLSAGGAGPMDETLDRVAAGEDDPACLECGGILKSATISFGENLVRRGPRPGPAGRAARDLFLALGTSLGVYPAAGAARDRAAHGARLVIVNAEETPFDDVADAVIRDQLGEVLPRSWSGLTAIRARAQVGNIRPLR